MKDTVNNAEKENIKEGDNNNFEKEKKLNTIENCKKDKIKVIKDVQEKSENIIENLKNEELKKSISFDIILERLFIPYILLFLFNYFFFIFLINYLI